MGLQDLPVETIVRCFSFLDYHDLVSVSCLNHFFLDVYETFPELKYSFALQVSGVIDADPSLDIRYKLEEIERRERAWRTMDLSRKTSVKVPHRTSHIYDLSGGVYLLGDCKNSVISRDTHTLRFFDLTTCADGPKVRTEPWPEMTIDANIVDIGFGLNEFDLVAVVGLKPGRNGEPGSVILSLRELSTGAPHPLARNPDIVIDPVTNDQGKLSIMLEIVGPRLLLLLTWHRGLQRIFQQDLDKLFLFNWWDGTKVMTETAPQLTWNGFVFLSPELVLLPHRDHGLEIIRLPDVTKGYSSKGFERVLRLALPEPQSLVKVGAIQCRAEPNPVGQPHPCTVNGSGTQAQREFAERMRAKKRSPVAPDPMKAVVLLQIYYREFNNEPQDILMGQWGVLRHNVSLVVHREFLIQLVEMFSNVWSPPSSTPDSSASASASTSLASTSSAQLSTDTDVTEESQDDRMDMDDDEGAAGAQSYSESSVRTINWGIWGRHARWMADDTHVSNWITTTAGQRYVGVDEEGHIIVKDFNPITVERARAAVKAAENDEDKDEDEDEDEQGVGDWISEGWEPDGSRSRAGGYSFQSIFRSFMGGTNTNTDSRNRRRSASESYLNHSPSYDYHQEREAGPPPLPTLNGDQKHASPPRPHAHRDTSWKSVRVIEGYNEIEDIELRQLFSEECKWPLPCVEYVSRRTYEYHGLLMDEERIIGLRHDEHTGAIVEFDVFTL